jgi:hypothetical protein
MSKNEKTLILFFSVSAASAILISYAIFGTNIEKTIPLAVGIHSIVYCFMCMTNVIIQRLPPPPEVPVKPKKN